MVQPLFDAVLFDLDGTLVATDRFWVQAARTGARRAFAELGLERELPDSKAWMSVVGLPLEQGFDGLFPELDPKARARVLARCVEEEERLLRSGGAALMPGAEALLSDLAGHGVRLGVASNCAQSYLDHMLGDLGLRRYVDAAYCLDSPGVHDKADMIERLLDRFETRSAFMVGDRVGDRDAAWANALPHVHCAFGFAGGGERVAAEATIDDLGELADVCAGRRIWIEQELAAAGCLRAAGAPRTIGITGGVAAGKTLFARDAARVLRERGTPAVAISLEAFRVAPPSTLPAPAPSMGVDAAALYDLERLERELLEPFLAGWSVQLADAWLLDPGAQASMEADTVLVLDGPLLLDPRLRARLDRVLYLDVPGELAWRRLAGRDARASGPRALEPFREGWMPVLAAHAARYAPEQLADRMVDASNPLGRPTVSAP